MKRNKPVQHVRKIKTIGGTKFIIVNKGVRRASSNAPNEVTINSRREAIRIIKEIMKANQGLARQRMKIVSEQAKLRPLSLAERDRLDQRENHIQKHGRLNRSKIKFLEREYDIDPTTKL